MPTSFAISAMTPGYGSRVIRACLCVALLALGTGCGGEDSPTPAEPQREERAGGRHAERPAEPARHVEPVHCPTGLAGCREASGRIAYVERVDPDGDGDAHFVLIDADGITGPGITVVDVRRDLRPHPLPGPGDELSAAGPVYPGSYGQRQIEAVAVNVAR
jgi:hypothetical protein